MQFHLICDKLSIGALLWFWRWLAKPLSFYQFWAPFSLLNFIVNNASAIPFSRA